MKIKFNITNLQRDESDPRYFEKKKGQKEYILLQQLPQFLPKYNSIN